MGNVILSRYFLPQKTDGLLKPIIYCCSYQGVDDQAISLNKMLAEALIQFQPKRRTMQIEKCFTDIIAKLPDNPIIKDFDVLFNPEYKVDILKIMINVCKKKPFSVIWHGKLDGNKLIYAEEQYRDYKVYEVDAYDITCVI